MKKVISSLDWFWITLGFLALLFAVVQLSNTASLDLVVQVFFLFSFAFIGKGFGKLTSNKIHIYSKIFYVILFLLIFVINLTAG